VDERENRLISEWMNGWMDGWMNGWMDGWMDGWVMWGRNGGITWNIYCFRVKYIYLPGSFHTQAVKESELQEYSAPQSSTK